MMRFRLYCAVLALLLTPLIARAEHKPLPEAYVSDNEWLTLNHPTGWVVWADQPGLVIVSTSDEPIRVGQDSISPGEAAVVVLFSNADDSYLREYFQGSSPAAVLDHFIQTVFVPATDAAVEFSESEAIHFADYPAARADGTFSNNSIFAIVADRGNGLYSLIIGITSPDELAKFEPKLLAIAESVRYLPQSE
jgi:hypothetical protein